MNWRVFGLAMLVVTLAAGVVWAGQTPLTEKAIPVFPGAIVDNKAKTQYLEESDGNPEGLLLGLGLEFRDEVYKVYSCDTGAEDVYRFYLKELDAEILSYAVEPDRLKPGESTPIDHELVFHKFKEVIDSSSGDVLYPGKLVRKTLAANRKPYSPEDWVSWVHFEWSVREKNNDLSGYTITIIDKSFSEDYKSYKTKTWIIIHRLSCLGGDEIDYGDEMDQAVAMKAKSLKQPTEHELGAPIYPGAVFDKELSAGMSLDDEEIFYIFQSADAPAKVILFYEQKLGKKAVKYGERHTIALKGEHPLPDHSVTIEPNKMGGPAKTVISFRKWSGD